MLQDKLLLVGSVAFDAAEEVLLTGFDMLDAHLACLPTARCSTGAIG